VSGGAVTQYVTIGPKHRVEVATGETGMGTTNTGYAADLDGSMSIASTTEQGLYFRRWGQLGGGSGPKNPLFMLGRLEASPPLYKAEFRYLYIDAAAGAERTIMSLESTGTWASISDGTRRSLCEGFLNNGDAEPIWRANASPQMGIELGTGGSSATDVGIRRVTAGEAWIDNGGASDACGTLKYRRKVSAKSSTPYVVLATDDGTVFTNEGASAKINFTLPTAVANRVFTFFVQDTDGIRINAASGDTIRQAANVSAAAGYIESTTRGDAITLVAINATEWVVISMVGTWTVV
jgi:hypothetical protein